MVNIPCAIYRSMIRISRKQDPELVNYLQTGLSTFKENSLEFYNFKYIHGDKVFFIYGPYENETANMLSYTKCMIRNREKTDNTMERLFFAHRELPNFFIAKEDLENEDEEQLLLKEKQSKKIKQMKTLYQPVPDDDSKPKPTSFGTSFGTSFF